MAQLRGRVQKLEAKAAPLPHTGCLRMIQDGELTAEQQRTIDEANVAGKLVIIRQIVSATNQVYKL